MPSLRGPYRRWLSTQGLEDFGSGAEGVFEDLVAGLAYFRRAQRAEPGGQLVAAEFLDGPVEKARQAGVRQRGLGDLWDSG